MIKLKPAVVFEIRQLMVCTILLCGSVIGSFNKRKTGEKKRLRVFFFISFPLFISY